MTLYVRVSDILAQVQDFSHIDPQVLKAKAQLGTNVHQAIADLVEGGFPIIASEKERNYFNSYYKWHVENKPEYHVMEQRLYDDELMITGQMDGIASFGEHERILIDYKTSYKANPDVWTLQAHFYHYLCKQNKLPVGDKMCWMNLQRTGGKPKLYFFDFDPKTMEYCVELTNKFWEDYNNARDTN